MRILYYINVFIFLSLFTEIFSINHSPFWIVPEECDFLDYRTMGKNCNYLADDRTQEILSYTMKNASKPLNTYLSVMEVTPSKNPGILEDLNIIFDADYFTIGFELYTFFYNNIDRRDINNELTYWQKYLFKKYKSGLHKIIDLNPIPGMSYGTSSHNPSYPYIFISTLDQFYFDLGTFPYTDDLRKNITNKLEYAYGFKFIYTLYQGLVIPKRKYRGQNRKPVSPDENIP